ncbi:hypothetical protein PAPHI01_2805, partial [Pancytospora philotis]
VYRRPDAAVLPCHSRATVSFGGGSVMVWGAITSQGVGELVFIESTMDANLFIKTLGTGLRDTVYAHNTNHLEIVLQQDNDPKHTSARAKSFINSNSIRLLPWPSYSPDLNLIENVWSIMKRRLDNMYPKPTGKEELKAAIEWQWYHLSPAYIKKLYGSLRKRLRQVVERKGRHADY